MQEDIAERVKQGDEHYNPLLHRVRIRLSERLLWLEDQRYNRFVVDEWCNLLDAIQIINRIGGC